MPARIRASDREYQKIIELQILTMADDNAKPQKLTKYLRLEILPRVTEIIITYLQILHSMRSQE
jgi:hypothetical protein